MTESTSTTLFGRRAGSTAASMPAARTTSRFNVNLMPSTIRRRTPQQFSVHFSIETNRWIATIQRNIATTGDSSEFKNRSVKFSFTSEREARKFAKAYSPPRFMTTPAQTNHCLVCSQRFHTTSHHRSSRSAPPHHCRNCGAAICDRCSTRWGTHMLPKTYCPPSSPQALTVRVCTSCDWLSNAFCMALLRGQFDDAKIICETGNVNLRTPFANINGEAMFPVHCATMGGSLALLRWLVETHACPVSVKRDPRNSRRMLSIQTSAGRSLIELAMTGRPKIDILKYLVMDKNMSILDTKDPTLAPRTLEVLLRSAGGVGPQPQPQTTTTTCGGGLNHDNHMMIHHLVESENDDSVSTTMEDACILCCEKPMDCVLIPCGHQVCCQECGTNLVTCPLCKVNCSVLRIFRQ